MSVLLVFGLSFLLCEVTGDPTAFCPEFCICHDNNMTCEGSIPENLPDTVTDVRVFGVNFALYVKDPPFNSTDWSNITSLYVNADKLENGTTVDNQDLFTMGQRTFYFLKQLKSLTFTAENMWRMNRTVFKGLFNLETLDFSGNVNLQIEDFITALADHDMTALKSLKLHNISQSRGVEKYFSGTFFDHLSTTRLEVLDLSYIDSAIMETESFARSLPYLREIVFEKSGYLGVNIFTSNVQYSEAVVYKTLRKININYSVLPEAVFSAGLLYPSNTYIQNSPNNFTTVRTRGCIPESKTSLLIGIDSTSCLEVQIQFPSYALNWTIFCLPRDEFGNLYLEELDIAENGIELLHPSLTSTASRLLYLDVSFNKLFKMSHDEMNRLLKFSTKLRTFIMSHNNLETIPLHMFTKSYDLVMLDLSHNNLKHLDFDQTALTRLKTLDLSYNKIAVLESQTRSRIDNIIAFYESSYPKGWSKVRVLLHHNPFECSCRTVDFQEWVLKVRSKCNFGNLTCNHKDQVVVIDSIVHEDSKFECKLELIYAITGSISGLVLVILIIVVIKVGLVCHRNYRKRRLESLVSKYKANSNGRSQKAPVFLSYSSVNSGFVTLNILPKINSTLKSLLTTSEDCVTAGDFNFRPGKYIADEIVRCVEESRVLVACVSRQFCKSHWCKNEIIVSQMENKPLVLLFLEPVEKTKMPKCLRKHFDKTTRCKVTKDSAGQVIFQPNVETVCESILQLMTKSNEFSVPDVYM